jgi:hypothetical protein
MKTIKTHLLRLLAFALVPWGWTACQDYDSEYSDRTIPVVRFQGSVLEYLDNGNFDSMSLILRRIPGLEEEMSRPGTQYTVFAIPDECFTASLDLLNRYRAAMNLGGPLSYSAEMLADPFQMEIEIRNPEDINNPLKDTITYDYRAQLEELICRYLFDGMFDTEEMIAQGGKVNLLGFRYNYPMQSTYRRDAASGVENMGVRRIVFSDTNGSQLDTRWTSAQVATMDIHADNGVIHVLDAGHEFSFNKLIPIFYDYGNEEGTKI